MGVFEYPSFAKGTLAVLGAVVAATEQGATYVHHNFCIHGHVRERLLNVASAPQPCFPEVLLCFTERAVLRLTEIAVWLRLQDHYRRRGHRVMRDQVRRRGTCTRHPHGEAADDCTHSHTLGFPGGLPAAERLLVMMDMELDCCLSEIAWCIGEGIVCVYGRRRGAGATGREDTTRYAMRKRLMIDV